MNLTTRILRRTPEISDEIHVRLERLAAQWLPTSALLPGRATSLADSRVGTSCTGTSREPEPQEPEPLDAVAAEEPLVTTTESATRDPQVGAARWLMPDRGSVRALLALVLLGSLIVGWMWWQGRPRPIALAPTTVADGVAVSGATAVVPGATDAGNRVLPPQSAEVVVHVVGSVKEPGLVRLPVGSRVDDAVKAAGGARSAKALSSVNLARQLVDGEQIVVGSAPGAVAGVGTSGGTAGGVSGPATGGISINSASPAELEELPGVGPVLAERIVQWRTTNGPFRSIDELGEVSGIGDSVLGQIRTQARL